MVRWVYLKSYYLKNKKIFMSYFRWQNGGFMRKRFFALVLSGIMMILSSDMVYASDNTVSIEDIIIQQAITADEVTDWSDYEFEVVEIQTEDGNTRSVDSSMKVLQTMNTEDGITTLTTLMPYKVVEDGKLVNSFEYAQNSVNSRSNKNYVDTFADVVVTTSVEYEEVGAFYYRHGGVTSYWSSVTVSSIDKLFVSYRSYGLLYYWTDGVGAGGLVKEELEDRRSVINESNPVKNQVYSQYDRTPSNQVFQFGGAHVGSSVNIQINNEMPQVYNIK